MYWFPGVSGHAGAPRAETFVKIRRWPRQPAGAPKAETFVKMRRWPRQPVSVVTPTGVGGHVCAPAALRAHGKALKKQWKVLEKH